jgi:hypothetical protein
MATAQLLLGIRDDRLPGFCVALLFIVRYLA